MVHRHGGRRLQVGPADRGVDQQADRARVDAALGQGLLPGHGGGVGEAGALVPPAPLADPGQALEQARAQPDPAQGVGQPLVELGRRDHHRCFDGGHRQRHRVGQPVRRVAAHAAGPLTPRCLPKPAPGPKRSDTTTNLSNDHGGTPRCFSEPDADKLAVCTYLRTSNRPAAPADDSCPASCGTCWPGPRWPIWSPTAPVLAGRSGWWPRRCRCSTTPTAARSARWSGTSPATTRTGSSAAPPPGRPSRVNGPRAPSAGTVAAPADPPDSLVILRGPGRLHLAHLVRLDGRARPGGADLELPDRTRQRAPDHPRRRGVDARGRPPPHRALRGRVHPTVDGRRPTARGSSPASCAPSSESRSSSPRSRSSTSWARTAPRPTSPAPSPGLSPAAASDRAVAAEMHTLLVSRP